jgi:hypothetical protein
MNHEQFIQEVNTLSKMNLESPVGVFSNNNNVFALLEKTLQDNHHEVIIVDCSIYSQEHCMEAFLDEVHSRIKQATPGAKKSLVLHDFTAICLENQKLITQQLVQGFTDTAHCSCQIYLTGKGAINECLLSKTLLPFGFIKISLENQSEPSPVEQVIENVKHYFHEHRF